MMLPEWAQAGGYQASMVQLEEPEESNGLRHETASRLAEGGVITLSYSEGGQELEGRVLGDLAHGLGQADVDFLLDLLALHAGRALAIYGWPDSIDGEEIIRRTLNHPLYIGSTDGIYMGSRPHRRGFGSFARIVGEHVRNGTVNLERAVHKVTGQPAERLSLRDPGLLQPGRAADVTIFDPVTLADRSTWDNAPPPPAASVPVLLNAH